MPLPFRRRAHGAPLHLPQLRQPHRPRPSAPPASAASAKGCAKCGFGFLFELLDDYYPAPDAAFFVCDQQGRVIGCGRGSFELTGLDDERVIGRPVSEVLGLEFDDGDDPSAPSSSGACARSASRSRSTPRATCPARATADLFPAYDDDGGLLLVLTPAK